MTKLKIQLELLAWLLTAIVVYLVIYPVLDGFKKFDFLYINILFVVVFITYTRYTFLLRHTFLAHLQRTKFVIIFASIPLVFYLGQSINLFEDFMGDRGLASFEAYLNPNISYNEQQAALNYMSREMIFFGTAAVISAIILPFRLLISFWRVYNNTNKV